MVANPGNINSVQGLANVIQGEALNNPADQFGVASTIANRLSGNYGYFGNTISQIVSPSQFNGYAYAPPGSNAYNLAQAIFNGNLSQYGDTGNVVYYSASNYSTNPNAPNYVNPSMQGVAGAGNVLSPGGNSYSAGTGTGPNVGATILPQLGGNGGNVSASNDPLGSSLEIDPNGASEFNSVATGSQGSADFNNVPDDLFDDSATGTSDAIGSGVSASALFNVPGGSLISALGGQSMGQAGTPLPGQQNTGEASIAGQSVKTGLVTAGTDVENASGGITGTFASAINSLEDYTNQAFIIFALVVIGAILVAYGLGMFKHGLAIPIPV